MRVVIAGSSGLVGTALRRSYQRDGHQVVRLVHREPAEPEEVRWTATAEADPGLLDGADVVVNLAGAGIGDRRWSRRYQMLIMRSRVETTQALAALAAKAAKPPAKLLSASGIRYYGIDRGDEVLTEASEPGSTGLLTVTAQLWEAATRSAGRAGVAVCHLRLGLVLSRHGGVVPVLLPYFRAGLGASLGSGREFWSYVSLTDTVRAIRFLADRPDTRGPYNITAPDPVRSKQFADSLAHAVGRRALLRMPAPAIRVMKGRIAGEVLGSLRVIPARLAEAGFRFHHPDVGSALHDALQGD